MKDEKEKLLNSIETARNCLDTAMNDFCHKEQYYDLSLVLDALIEQYIDMQERERQHA